MHTKLQKVNNTNIKRIQRVYIIDDKEVYDTEDISDNND